MQQMETETASPQGNSHRLGFVLTLQEGKRTCEKSEINSGFPLLFFYIFLLLFFNIPNPFYSF